MAKVQTMRHETQIRTGRGIISICGSGQWDPGHSTYKDCAQEAKWCHHPSTPVLALQTPNDHQHPQQATRQSQEAVPLYEEQAAGSARNPRGLLQYPERAARPEPQVASQASQGPSCRVSPPEATWQGVKPQALRAAGLAAASHR